MKPHPTKTEMEIQNLPDAEMDVLGSLMQIGEATVREIRESMQDRRPMTHGAAVSLLTRLEAKGLVDKEKGNVGKAFVYRSTLPSTPVIRSLTEKWLNLLFGGSRIHMVASLFESAPPTQEELKDLRKLLKQLQNETK